MPHHYTIRKDGRAWVVRDPDGQERVRFPDWPLALMIANHLAENEPLPIEVVPR